MYLVSTYNCTQITWSIYGVSAHTHTGECVRVCQGVSVFDWAIVAFIRGVRAAGAGAVFANLLHTGRRTAVSSPLAHVHPQHACMHTLVCCMSASYGGRINGGSAADTLQTHLTRSSTCPPHRRCTLSMSSRRSRLSTRPPRRRCTWTRPPPRSTCREQAINRTNDLRRVLDVSVDMCRYRHIVAHVQCRKPPPPQREGTHICLQTRCKEVFFGAHQQWENANLVHTGLERPYDC